jgi:hypothetical protein
VESIGLRYARVASCCEHDDEISGSGATELVNWLVS